jgi:hypothetical protein
MSSVLTLWHAQYTATSGALRQDARARITWAISLVVDLVAGFWTFNVLSGNLAQWQAAGQVALATHLWLFCLYTWAGISFFAVIAVVSQGFGNDQAILLISMPLSPATRLRALYGLVVFTGVGNWIVLANVVIAISLVTKLHWQALPWLLMLDLGVSATVCMSLIATLLVIHFALPHLKRTFIGLSIASVSVGAVVLLLRASKYSLHVTIPVLLMPVLISSFCVLLLLIILGPLASSTGMLYQRAFYTMEGRSARRAALMLPGVHMFSMWLSRYRTLTGALLYKGLLNQSRNVFTWGRAAILVICVALFPLIQKVMIACGFSSLAQVTVYSSVVAIIAVVEYAAYAISSEGARMSYYVLAPFHIATYLRARLVVFLLPVLFIGLTVCLALTGWLRLPIYDTGMAALLMILLLVGYTACIVWGSAFDLDINQVAEGAMQTLMLEELPVTPRRLQLLGLSTLLLVGMILLILKLPVVLSVFALVLLDGAVYVGLWRFGLIRLRGLV